ncbi:glycosyltransferase [Brumicola blandensis]|uniref:Glycosyltransferase n=1 Tax=Brumicola blandensis TaxID=3075611 RepID=A0AAW8R6G9_9ALTE|nr:glycosyltransferase [Alteromonas sp. W409]MDT0584069.1 glycosyltransferase [Alteromonas sp. W409]
MSKIVIVIHDLRGGGAEKMMVRLANAMSMRGHTVTLLLVAKGGANLAIVSPEVKVIQLACDRTLSAFMPLRIQLKALKADAILSALTHINVLTFLVCMSLGMRHKLSMSERNTFSHDKLVNKGAVMKLAYALAPWCYRFASKPVIAVSKGVANDLVATSIARSKDVVVAPNPVVATDFLLQLNSTATHPWLLNKQGRVIIAIGRLCEQKGFDLLLKAFSILVDKEANKEQYRLIIFGEGELRPQLEQRVLDLNLGPYVSLPGYAENPVAEMQAADLFVLPSRFEGSPNVLVEAMAAKLPVVAFDCPHGPKEILAAVEKEALVPYLDIKALSSRMETALQQKTNIDIYPAIISRFEAAESAKIYLDFMLAK